MTHPHPRAELSDVVSLRSTRVTAKLRAMSPNVCRLCRSLTAENRCVSLFTSSGLQQGWSSRINHLVAVPVASGDGLPKHICRACKTRLEVLERAAKDLLSFRELAKRSHSTLVLPKGPLKRTKVSSGDGVSPDTAHARPPAKKLSTRRLDFGPSSVTLQCKNINILLSMKLTG